MKKVILCMALIGLMLGLVACKHTLVDQGTAQAAKRMEVNIIKQYSGDISQAAVVVLEGEVYYLENRNDPKKTKDVSHGANVSQSGIYRLRSARTAAGGNPDQLSAGIRSPGGGC